VIKDQVKRSAYELYPGTCIGKLVSIRYAGESIGFRLTSCFVCCRMQLSQRMKNSEVLHRIRNSVTGCSTAVAMKLYAPTCCIRFSRFSRSFGIGQRKLRRFLRKDIASGEDVFNRIYMHLEITIVGQTTAALALVSLSCLFMLIITLIFHSILKGILLPLV
jgi:hypothetical protein